MCSEKKNALHGIFVIELSRIHVIFQGVQQQEKSGIIKDLFVWEVSGNL